MSEPAPSITYVVSQYPAISHTFILGEVNGLLSQGFETQVASINQPDRPYEKLTETEQQAYEHTFFIKSELLKRLPVYLFKTLKNKPKGFFKSLLTSLKNGLRYPVQLPKYIAYWLEAMVVADIAENNNSQQLHAHFSTQGCTVAMLASQIQGIPFSMTVHGPDEFYQVNEQYLEQKFAAANFIVCISDFARSQVMKFSQFDQWQKIYVNNLGVDAALFRPEVKNNQVPTLLCVGRLVNAKGQGVLIQAARELKQRGIAFQLQMVGDGPDKLSLEAFVAANNLGDEVKFLGKVNHNRVQELQRQADIFVLPSFAEGIPIVLMEAMASGTPCVTTHITGIPELFTNEFDGLLVRPGNEQLLADALERLITDKALYEKIASNALQTVREKWSIDASNQRLAELFSLPK